MDGAGGSGGGAAPSGAGAPAAAPAAAPSAPTGGAPAPESAARAPVMFRPKDADREFDISEAIENHLRGYARKVKVDGQEVEIPLEDAYKHAGLETASRRRFNEATKLRDEAKRAMEAVDRAARAIANPERAEVVLSNKWGRQKFDAWIISHAERILAEENLSPADRRALDVRRERERQIEERQAAIDARDAELRRKEEAGKREAHRATRERVEREWPPMLRSLGVPEGFTRDAMKGMIAEINEAKKLGIGLSEREAASRVAAEIRRKIGVLAPPAPTPETVAKQPGRESPPPAAEAQDRARGEDGRFKKKGGVLRPDHIWARLNNVGR